jgi:hypothetical protein
MGKGVDLDGAECAAADPKFGEGSVDDKKRTDGEGCRRVETAATRRQNGNCDGRWAAARVTDGLGVGVEA